MGFFSRLTRHEPLFRGMADRLGVDFNKWVGTSADHASDYRNAVLNCTACKSEGACQTWLAANETADKAPDFCRNRRLLEALSKA
jgi:hypothetical protein